jgi:thiamine biosynthesis lipoprotein
MEESRKKRLIWQLPFLALLIVGTVLIIRQQRNLPYHTDR